MSGHSHAKTVKRTKDANDAKRGKIFSKMARLISIAAKEGGDPAMNSKLRSAIDAAKKANMPKDNVERAIRKGTGEEAGEQLEEMLYEGIGPGGANFILECITDNKNRTLSAIKQIFQKNNAKLADEGSVKWAFDQKGIIIVKATNNKEALELKAIESGAEDLKWLKNEDNEDILEIITPTETLETVKNNLEKAGVETESSTLGWSAKENMTLSEKSLSTCQKILEELEDNDDVQEIYSNFNL